MDPRKANPGSLSREKGNEIYLQLRDTQSSGSTLAPAVIRIRLQKASELYGSALSLSNDSGEKASCYKNMGALNFLWTKYEWKFYVTETNPQSQQGKETLFFCKRRLSMSLGFYLKAASLSYRKGGPWRSHVEQSLTEIVQWARKQLEKEPALFDPVMRSLCKSSTEEECEDPLKKKIAVMTHLSDAQILFQNGVKCLHHEEEVVSCTFKKCLSFLRECHHPLCIAKGYANKLDDVDLQDQVEILVKDVNHYKSICEAIQARIQAEGFIEQALRALDGGEKEASHELAWDAIDLLRLSLGFTEDILLENEAIALSMMGKCYTCILDLKDKAHTYHFQSVSIALAMGNSRISAAEWYLFSGNEVRKHQQRVVEEEEKRRRESMETSVERMKDKIAEIEKNAASSAEAFIKFLYEKFPHPDVSKRTGPPLGSVEETKSALRKVILVYHPDSNVKQEKDWQALCEAITKILSRKYESYK